jgi:hypothetical protein
MKPIRRSTRSLAGMRLHAVSDVDGASIVCKGYSLGYPCGGARGRIFGEATPAKMLPLPHRCLSQDCKPYLTLESGHGSKKLSQHSG